MFTLEIHNRTQSRIPKSLFTKLLPRAQRYLVRERRIPSRKNYHLELSFVGTQTMEHLNAIYHYKNHSTDVISLSYFSPTMKDFFVGEIFICLPFARQQAKKIGQPFFEELRFLFMHGLLHCFGYDHKKPREEAHMKQLTYRILGRV